MKGQGGGGTARGGGKTRSAGESITVTKSKVRQTKAVDENIILLREALFESNGKDKDVTKGVSAAFLKFDRSGLNLRISFSHKLSSDELDWAFDMVKSAMEEVYDASGYGWDDKDKERELSEDGTRFLLLRDAESNELVGFVHFRFTVQGEVMDVMSGEPSLYIWDIHLQEHIQRKGVGRHLMTILELIARQQKMRLISVPIQMNDDSSLAWVSSLRGYAPDSGLALFGFDPDMEGFQVYCKNLPARPQTVAVSATVATPPPPPSPAAPLEQRSDVEVPACSTSDVSSTPITVATTEAEDRSIESVNECNDKADSEDGVDLSSITLQTALSKLKELFVEKNHREPTDDEVASWEEVLLESGAGEEASPDEDTETGLCDEDGYVVVERTSN